MTGEIVISVSLMLLTAGAFVISLSFPSGTSDGVPGAGFFPQILCSVIFILNVLNIIQAIKKRKAKPEEAFTTDQITKLKQILVITLATVAMIFLWGSMHFIILCSFYLIIFNIVLKQSPKYYLPGSLATAIIIYIVFEKILNVMLNS